MKKFLLLAAAALIFQVTPVLANDHEGASKDGRKGKMFEKHDTNGDGVISQSEFLENAKKKFAEMDTNGDGSISKEEGKAAHESRREKMKEKREAWKQKREERSDKVTD